MGTALGVLFASGGTGHRCCSWCRLCKRGKGVKGRVNNLDEHISFFGWDDPFAELNAEAASEQIHVRL